MQTIQDRGYVWKKGSALVPSWTAFAVIGLLESYFARLVDYGFTASVENDLDSIAGGTASRVEWLRRFYFGANGAVADPARISAQGGLKRLIESAAGGDRRAGRQLDPAGRDGVGRAGRALRPVPAARRGAGVDPGGPGARRAHAGEGRGAAERAVRRPRRSASATADGREITAKTGRYGPYVTDGEKSASLFKTMSLDTVTLADALQLLTLPRALGVIDGEEVTAQNGRYGPYVKRGSDSRSLDTEDQLFTVTLDEAKALFAQPKTRGRRTAAAPPLRELGTGPGLRQADGDQGRPVRALRHRRRDERVVAPRRLGRGAHRRPGRRTARRTAYARARQEEAARKAPAKKRPQGAPKERPPRRRAPAKKAT